MSVCECVSLVECGGGCFDESEYLLMCLGHCVCDCLRKKVLLASHAGASEMSIKKPISQSVILASVWIH